ncbi:MAG TPA: Fic family protein [Caldilineae bacterium]|nr:Fic family protein [Caldilineae bacterium]
MPPSTIWQPKYTISPAIARHLMDVEAAKTVVAHTPLSPAAEAELRYRARLRSTHYSTRIEGNRLSLQEAEKVITEPTATFRGRERDTREVRNYWDALIRVEEWAAQRKPLTEELIRRLHAIVERGARARPTPYRDGQNVIRDSATGLIVYMPPEAKDVAGLMAGLVNWIHEAEKNEIPVPIIAGLAHYQFVTIHPYFDGNGRTARLLATFLLHRGGYGLNGFFSLEEHHARDLAGYYQALSTHAHHNYYEGRAAVDLTPWLEYFMGILVRVFKLAEEEALRLAARPAPVEPELMRQLDRRARIVLGLFSKTDQITTAQVAQTLGLSDRMARNLLRDWVEQGWLLVAEPSRRKRSYALSAVYRQHIDSLSAMDDE